MTYNVTEVDRCFIPMFARLACELSDEGEEQSKLYKRVMDICHWLKSAHKEIVTVRDALAAAEARIKELETGLYTAIQAKRDAEEQARMGDFIYRTAIINVLPSGMRELVQEEMIRLGEGTSNGKE